jgi:hypothetical protein
MDPSVLNATKVSNWTVEINANNHLSTSKDQPIKDALDGIGTLKFVKNVRLNGDSTLKEDVFR